MKKKPALIGLAFLLLLALGLYGLLNSANGSRWLLQQVLAFLPGQTSVAKIEGTLLDTIQLTQLHYESATEQIAIDHLKLSWQPGQLPAGRLKINDINLDGIDITIKQKQPEATGQFDWGADLRLPLQLLLDRLSISHLQYRDTDTEPLYIQQLTLAASTEQDQLLLQSLRVEASPVLADIQGQIKLHKRFPFVLTAKWQIDTAEYGRWQASTQLSGDARQVKIGHRQASPFPLTIIGQMDNPQTNPNITLRGDWQKLGWPLSAAQPQISSEQGFFEISGALDNYQLSLNGPLAQDYLPGARLDLKGAGNLHAVTIKELRVASDAGSLNIDGIVDWQSDTSISLNAIGKQFNPAIFLPSLPGKLTFDSHLNAKFSERNPEIELIVNSLSGQLRGNAIAAGGKLSMADETYLVENLNIHSGRNHILAHGQLSPAQSNLSIDIDAPTLAVFWPGLSGNLKASGTIQGNPRNPAMLFTAQGHQLQFETHKIERLSFDLDYQPDNAKTSKLRLSAGNIKAGGGKISALDIQGSGSLPQHQLTLNLKSTPLTVSGGLSGGMTGQNWQSTINKFSLDGPDWGAWQLQAPSKVQVIGQDHGFDLQLSELCLIRNTAFICGNSHYQADADFKLQLKAAALPAAVFQTFLPEQLHPSGLLDAEADFQQQKGLLSGQYRLEMPSAEVVLKHGANSRSLALGRSHAQGRIKNNLLTGQAEIGLTHADFLRAAFQINTRTAHNFSAHIGASISEWDLITPFIPADELSGQLMADLNLQGSMAAPLITGQIDLNDAAIELSEAGIGLKHIDMQARAMDGKLNRILLNGTAEPVLLPHNTQFNGKLALSAELEPVNNGIKGRYHLNIPANSSLSFNNAETGIQVPFAASSLTGEINGGQLSANLELFMLNRDFLRAKLQADTGHLSGHIRASMSDLTVFNALLPEVSGIKGLLKTDLSVQGTPSQPVAQGSLQLTQGAADIADLGIALRDIQIGLTNAPLMDEHLLLTGTARSGEGRLNIQGLLHLNGNADITLQGSDFEVAKLPEAQIAISPDLKLTLTENGGKASGIVQIPKAIIVMEDLPRNAVKVSEDEVMAGQSGQNTKSATVFGWETHIDVVLGQQVSFSGQGLTTDLTGQLKIGKSEDKTSLHGTIDMKNGHYQSYGQDLSVRKGRFMFNGPVDAPWLDVEAIRVSKEQDVTAILSLTGPLKTPKTRIYSEPSLPEAEALAYLMTGSPLSQVSKADGNMVAGAAMTYGAGKLSWLTEKLGVDEFEVKQGKTLNDTLLSIGEYLTPDFYIGSKIGIFDKQAMLVLRHNLTKTIKIETQAGTSQRVKLNYEIDTD